ncbi:MAG: Sortase family protein [Firmicutes bacterium ADurb.BinA205]|nr:MAG: Sortase family protein [Firmicutes bacterium ADurb.BinA205]
MKINRRTVSNICLAAGIVLLIAALSLVLYNIHQDRQSGEKAHEVLAELKGMIPEETTPPVTTMFTEDLFALYESTTTEPIIESSVEIDGHTYIGFVSIPSIGIELPVIYEWSYPNLKISPCRYKGSALTDDLIIAAHNYTTHFGKIGNLHSGDEIVFTDTDGKKYEYEVNNIEQLPGTAVEDMEFGSAEDWDLTLFTCTLGGQSRVTVRASRIP